MTFTKRFTATSSGVILGLDEVKVSQIMTKKIAQVDPDTGIEKYMDIMGKHRVRHLPVVEKGKVVGVITSTDVLILSQQAGQHHRAARALYFAGRLLALGLLLPPGLGLGRLNRVRLGRLIGSDERLFEVEAVSEILP